MNYNHEFHAGSFSDIIKHLTLIHEIEYYKLKNKPIVFFDTHAGQGIYDLYNEKSQRTGEYLTGINLVYKELKQEFPVFCKLIESLNVNSEIRYYPGSPYIIKNLKRESDKGIFIEKNKVIYEKLLKLKDTNILIHNRDGYEALNALLPLEEKRGVIIIDPAFEEKNEFIQIKTALEKLLKKFSTPTIIIWFPIKDEEIVDSFLDNINQLTKNYIYLITEFDNIEQNSSGMKKCGLIVINPTWNLNKFWNDIKSKLKSYSFKIYP
ncbi:MAG: 23S rRNA (adenine(2030)-N(6))-methyltransferase RlmJ [Sphingobacteriia bacterium]|nr:23S rRNA (adenine(2030)-N(6))-methyltransferase RlmJ [Sphingobacteriia bacterium]